MTIDITQIIGFLVGLATLFSLIGGGVWWLVKIAINKGTTQADGLSQQITSLGRNIYDKMEYIDASSKARHEETKQTIRLYKSGR